MAWILMPSMHLFGQNRLAMSFVDANGRTVHQMESTIGEDFTEPTLMIQPADAPTAIDHVNQKPENINRKFIQNGQIYILRGDYLYTTDSIQVRYE